MGSFGELTSENVFEAWSECCPETIGSFVLGRIIELTNDQMERI